VSRSRRFRAAESSKFVSETWSTHFLIWFECQGSRAMRGQGISTHLVGGGFNSDKLWPLRRPSC
jgi:hypothetical protein